MSKENKPLLERSSYVPYILPEWKNECKSDKPHVSTPTIVQLTNENASKYSDITSHVGWRRRIDYALQNIETTDNQDPNKFAGLLENVISTVIVLASNGSIPDEYLISTYLFLRKVRNEFGENPPNIASFMEFLKTKASEKVLSIIQSVEVSELKKLPPNLTITAISKNVSRQSKNSTDQQNFNFSVPHGQIF